MPVPERDPVTHLLRVFLAYPGDCSDEIHAVRSLIESFNGDDAKDFGVRLEPWEWKDNLRPAIGDPQKLADEFIDQAHIVVAVFKHKPGSPTPDADGGTVHEVFRTIHRYLAERDASKRPALLTYFSEELLSKRDNDDKAALKLKAALARFRNRIEKDRIATFARFTDKFDLKEKVRKHLREVVRPESPLRHRTAATETSSSSPTSPAKLPHFGVARHADNDREPRGHEIAQSNNGMGLAPSSYALEQSSPAPGESSDCGAVKVPTHGNSRVSICAIMLAATILFFALSILTITLCSVNGLRDRTALGLGVGSFAVVAPLLAASIEFCCNPSGDWK